MKIEKTVTLTVNEAVQSHLDITAQIKELSEQRSTLTEAIISEFEATGVKFIAGTVDDHGLKLVEAVRWALNQKAVKEELGENWVTSHSTQTLVKSLRLSRES